MTLRLLNRVLFGIAIFSLLISVTGCRDSATGHSLEPPINIEFNFQSKGQLVAFNVIKPSSFPASVTIEWDLGDGQRSQEFQPIHYYGEAGTYRVTVLLTDQLMRETSFSREVTVAPQVVCEANWRSVRGSPFFDLQNMAGSELGFSMVGQMGTVLFSENGFDWCETSTQRGELISSISWSGNAFWAVAGSTYFDTTLQTAQFYNVLLKSSDGLEWISSPAPSAQVTEMVVQDGQVLVLGSVPCNGSTTVHSVFASGDDGSWQQVLASEYELSGLFWSGNRYFIFGRTEGFAEQNKADLIWTSTNGLDWTKIKPTHGIAWTSLASNGPRLVRVHDRLEISSDGLTWSPLDTPLPETMFQVQWGGNRFLAIGNTHAMVSANGKDWQSQPLPLTIDAAQVKIAWNGWIWMLAGESGPLCWSATGRDWQLYPETTPSLPEPRWTSICADEQGYLVTGFRLAKEGGILETGTILDSSDGLDWRQNLVRSYVAISDAVRTPIGLIGVGYGSLSPENAGRIFLRQTGEWREVLRTTNAMEHIQHLGNQSIAIDEQGNVFRSTNGTQWQAGPNLGNIRQAKVIDSSFWLLAENGRLLQSHDGLSWIETRLPDEMSRSFAFAEKDGTWVVCGDKGRGSGNYWARSDDLQRWTTFKLPYSTSYRTLFSHEEGFIASGLFSVNADGSARGFPHASLLTSDDGLTWIPAKAPNIFFQDFALGPNGLAAIAGHRLLLREEVPTKP